MLLAITNKIMGLDSTVFNIILSVFLVIVGLVVVFVVIKAGINKGINKFQNEMQASINSLQRNLEEINKKMTIINNIQARINENLEDKQGKQ